MRLIDADKLVNQCKEYSELLKFDGSTDREWATVKRIIHMLNDAPTIEPEQHWIPVTERLPEENIPVLLGVRFKDDFKYFVSARLDYNYWSGIGREIIGELRWMPLPESYKEK